IDQQAAHRTGCPGDQDDLAVDQSVIRFVHTKPSCLAGSELSYGTAPRCHGRSSSTSPAGSMSPVFIWTLVPQGFRL
ncbi:MAG: hypothetical protein ACE5EC_07325, partial [Phycisphaerae bacterium]